MDFITQLPPSNGYTAIAVFVDRFTKMAHFVPTHDNVSAQGTVDLFLQRVFSAHGLPDDIVSDRGATFTASFASIMFKSLGIEQKLSTAYHQRTDGQIERVNSILEQYLRGYVDYQQSDWSCLLPIAEFAYNNTTHSSTGTTPFYANLGYHP
jgi:transposase InsO family protein